MFKFIMALMFLSPLAMCVSQGNAMTIVESKQQYSEKLDLSVRDQIKAYICSEIDCPEHLKLDELKISWPATFASMHE